MFWRLRLIRKGDPFCASSQEIELQAFDRGIYRAILYHDLRLKKSGSRLATNDWPLATNVWPERALVTLKSSKLPLFHMGITNTPPPLPCHPPGLSLNLTSTLVTVVRCHTAAVIVIPSVIQP